MSLGILVEGQSDRTTIPKLLEGLRQTVRAVRVVPQGRMLNVNTMTNHIDVVTRSHRLSRVLIFIDSEGVDPDHTSEQTRRTERELNNRFPRLPINYIVVDHSIEGWLACDQSAVLQVVGGSRQLYLINDPEAHPRPARLLERLFRANGKEFRKTTHNQAIAALVDPKVIMRKSPTFKRLVSLLRRH